MFTVKIQDKQMKQVEVDTTFPDENKAHTYARSALKANPKVEYASVFDGLRFVIRYERRHPEDMKPSSQSARRGWK